MGKFASTSCTYTTTSGSLSGVSTKFQDLAEGSDTTKKLTRHIFSHSTVSHVSIIDERS